MSNSWADESEMGDDDGVGIGGREVQQPQQRPRLQLKPRSQNPASEHTSSTSSTTTSKSNPFGAAKPREEVLASKGIDASLVDAKVERKASIPRLTAEQDRRIEALRKELTAVEERLREANEMELPEEDLRIESESKREELNVLIAAFHEANFLEKNGSATGSSSDGKLLVSTNKPTSREHQEGSWKSVTKDGSGLQRAPLEYTGTTSTSSSSKDGDGAAGPKKFERPSERRRRLEQEKGGGGYDDRGGYGGGGGGGNDDAFSNFGNNRGGGGRGDGRGGGGGYNNRNNDEGYNNGVRGHQSNNSNNSGYNEKYASDRYNY